MRILLINVCGQPQVRIPQGLLYLASAVHAAGHEVFVHDEALVSDPDKSLEHITSCNADVIGLSVYTFPRQLRRTERLSQTLKNLRKTTPIIWGGWHATLYPEQSIANEYVDIVRY